MVTIGLKLYCLFHGLSIGYYCWRYFADAFFGELWFTFS